MRLERSGVEVCILTTSPPTKQVEGPGDSQHPVFLNVSFGRLVSRLVSSPEPSKICSNTEPNLYEDLRRWEGCTITPSYHHTGRLQTMAGVPHTQFGEPPGPRGGCSYSGVVWGAEIPGMLECK